MAVAGCLTTSSATDLKLSRCLADAWALLPGRGQPTEQALVEIAEAMATSGLRDAGYDHISTGELGLVRNATTQQLELEFPERWVGGDLKHFSSYLHHNGFKLIQGVSPGATSCTGEVGVCGPRPASEKYPRPENCHAAADARWLAAQGTDMWAADWCQFICENNASCYVEQYSPIWEAIQDTGSNMTFGLCARPLKCLPSTQ